MTDRELVAALRGFAGRLRAVGDPDGADLVARAADRIDEALAAAVERRERE